MTLESLAQSLQHLSLAPRVDTGLTSIELEEAELVPIMRVSSRDISIREPSIREPDIREPESSRAADPPIHRKPVPPLPSPRLLKRCHTPSTESITSFCGRWSIDGPAEEDVKALLRDIKPNHRFLLMSSIDRLGRFMVTGANCVETMRTLSSLHGQDLIGFARDAEFLLKAMFGGAESQNLNAVKNLRGMHYEARSIAMDMLRGGLLDGANNAEAAQVILSLTTMDRQSLKEVRTYSRGVKKLGGTVLEQRAISLLPSGERPDMFIAIRKRNEREELTKSGMSALIAHAGLQDHFVPKVLYRVHYFLGDTRAQPRHVQRALDERGNEGRAIRAHAFDGLRLIKSRFTTPGSSFDDRRVVTLFTAAWFLSEAHPTQSYDLRLALARLLTFEETAGDWDFRESILMIMKPVCPKLDFGKLSRRLLAASGEADLSASQDLSVSQTLSLSSSVASIGRESLLPPYEDEFFP